MSRPSSSDLRPLPPLLAVPFYVIWATLAFRPLRDHWRSPGSASMSVTLRRLLFATIVVHVGEATFAFNRARSVGRDDQAVAWAASTMFWGALSLLRLHRLERGSSVS